MAYINPQVQIDQQQDARANQNYAAIGQGVLSGLEFNRQRALEAKRQKELQDAQDLAFAKDGVTPEAVQAYRETGDKSQIMSGYKALKDAATLKALNDATLDRQFKESQINANNAKAAKYRNGGSGMGGKGSVAEQSVDRNFGKTYDDFIVGGGYSKVERGLKSLQEVSDNLGKKAGPNLTGGLIGRMPDFVNQLTGNSEAVEARDQVGTIIQDNLRAILGPAYTEREGENVIRRAYDPTLSEAANKKKLDGVITQMKSAAKAKLEAAKYYEQHGTMRGYNGTVVNNVDDVFKVGNSPSSSSGPWDAKKPDAKIVNTVKSMSDEQLAEQARALGLIP